MTNKIHARLAEIVDSLPEEQRRSLMEFAEFLSERHARPAPPGEPVPIPRPENENVVNAIKRLSATYPMLDTEKLFNETSALMMQHLLKGQPATEIIDELETLFERHYRAMGE